MGTIVTKPISASTVKDAKAIFGQIDVNGDRQLSIEELIQAANSHGREIKAAWPEARIRATVAAHDTNKDGKLNRNEWVQALTALVKSDPGPQVANSPLWYRLGGSELDVALTVDSAHGQAPVRLVDAAYLVKLATKKGALLPRRQDLPESAFLSHDVLKQLPRGFGRSSLRIIVVSHAWLHPNHPDPRGESLRLLARVLTEYMKGWGQFKGGTYGVFLDYCSLFQKGKIGEERTATEAALFQAALGSMDGWYSHPRTTVLKITKLPPGYPHGFDFPTGVEANTASYDGRGWCYTESSVANLVKGTDLSLDLGQLKPDKPYNLKELVNICTKFYTSKGALRAAPLTPEAFAEQLEQKSFTSKKADIALVGGLYAAAFQSRLGTARELAYVDLSWRPADVVNFNKVVASGVLATALTTLRLHMNAIGDEGAQALAEAMKADCLPQIEVLGLAHTAIGDAGLIALAGAMEHVPKISDFMVGAQVGDEGATALAAALAAGRMPQLAKLGLDELIGDTGAEALVKALVEVRESKPCPLEELSIGRRLSDVGLKSFAGLIAQGGLHGCRDLRLERAKGTDYGYSEAGYAALAAVVEQSGATMHIGLGSETYYEGEEKGRMLVEEALRTNRRARYLQHQLVQG